MARKRAQYKFEYKPDTKIRHWEDASGQLESSLLHMLLYRPIWLQMMKNIKWDVMSNALCCHGKSWFWMGCLVGWLSCSITHCLWRNSHFSFLWSLLLNEWWFYKCTCSYAHLCENYVNHCSKADEKYCFAVILTKSRRSLGTWNLNCKRSVNFLINVKIVCLSSHNHWTHISELRSGESIMSLGSISGSGWKSMVSKLKCGGAAVWLFLMGLNSEEVKHYKCNVPQKSQFHKYVYLTFSRRHILQKWARLFCNDINSIITWAVLLNN